MKNSTDDYPELADTNKQNELAFFIMALLGGGEILGGNFVAFFRDKIGNKVAYVVQIILMIVAFCIIIVYNHKNRHGYLAYLMTFSWGFQDAGLNCLMRSLLGFEFDDQSTPFSVFNFVQSLFVFVCQIIQQQVMNPDFSDQKQVDTL